LSNLRLARAHKFLKKAHKEKTRRHFTPRRRKTPYISKKQMKEAIVGSRGVLSKIADRVGVSWVIIKKHLDVEGWDDVRDAYNEECERVGDLAEDAVQFAIMLKVDLRVSLDAAKWYLQQKWKKRGYSDKSTVKVEGGDSPIKVLQANISVDALDLPPEIMREILGAVERREKLAQITGEE